MTCHSFILPSFQLISSSHRIPLQISMSIVGMFPFHSGTWTTLQLYVSTLPTLHLFCPGQDTSWQIQQFSLLRPSSFRFLPMFLCTRCLEVKPESSESWLWPERPPMDRTRKRRRCPRDTTWPNPHRPGTGHTGHTAVLGEQTSGPKTLHGGWGRDATWLESMRLCSWWNAFC